MNATNLQKRKVNISLLFQWSMFFPLILFVSLLGGAINGVISVFQQAERDILN
jgi:hypothetical protein